MNSGLLSSCSEYSITWACPALVLPLRRYFRSVLEVARQSLYAVPYWRRGKSEEAYHQARHDVMDN